MNLKAWCAAVLCAFMALPAVALERAKFVKRVPPQYPSDALDKNVQGCVTISFVVGPDGLADDYEVVSSEPKGVFDKAGLLALNNSKLEPSDAKTRYYVTLRFFPDDTARQETRCDLSAQ